MSQSSCSQECVRNCMISWRTSVGNFATTQCSASFFNLPIHRTLQTFHGILTNVDAYIFMRALRITIGSFGFWYHMWSLKHKCFVVLKVFKCASSFGMLNSGWDVIEEVTRCRTSSVLHKRSNIGCFSQSCTWQPTYAPVQVIGQNTKHVFSPVTRCNFHHLFM